MVVLAFAVIFLQVIDGFLAFQNLSTMDLSTSCIQACNDCAIKCEACVTDSAVNGIKECLRWCRDCADLCTLCARFEARGSAFSKKLHDLCAEVCRACAAECLKHAAHHETCKSCAKSCAACAELCEKMATAGR